MSGVGVDFEVDGAALPRPHDNCYWLAPGLILAGEYPITLEADGRRGKIGSILEAGVRRFIDLTEAHELDEYQSLLHSEAAASGLIVDYRRHPVRDLSVPSRARMRQILDDLQAGLRTDQPIPTYLHCWGGIGRTGTVVGCLLVEQGYSADQAIALIARKWTVVGKRTRRPHSPETPEQFRFIRQWRAQTRRP